MITKYEIQFKDFYNFNEIGFMMNVIISFIIITHFDRHKKIKIVQFDNQKWITVIECINILN